MNRLPPLQSLVEGPGWVGIMSQWVMWKVFHLSEFLDPEGSPHWLWRRGKTRPEGLKAIAGIGYKRSSDQARVLCKRWDIPYVALEDGFLRSSSLGVEGDTPMSMVVDPIGIHYLADRPSLLENILQTPSSLLPSELATAHELIALMRSSGIGKYNNAPDLPADDPLGRDTPLILVVDQTYGDFSIPGGGLREADFIRMLDEALAQNPTADVRVRIHPDCINGHKKSCLLDAALARGVTLESRHVSWASLARRAARVYVGTSQAGLEALIQGIPVTCFGLPFYAGWGLTDDRLAIPRRQAQPSLEQLVAAAYIRYCRYVDPLTDQRCDVMTVAHQLARQKHQDSLFAGNVTVLGVPRRQHATLRRLLDSRWGQLKFSKDSSGLMAQVARERGKLLVWAASEAADVHLRAKACGLPVWRISPGTWTSSERDAPTSLMVDCRAQQDAASPHTISQADDLQHLVQVRGLPCSHQQAQAHAARASTGRFAHWPRGRQLRRYLKGMF
ncbi:capsular polysaccharide export protein [Pseudomonas sp. ok272]|uniref:capsular polysaccharide export protein, LipB/KpsS family n=1 Tax=unclassified Pseudomonas TaxID=196821 RepID=UPI0008C4910D|nr:MULTISPECIES: capsule biosynthesis protein [unclassified Pseudomonas]SEM99178.1 capsular polysaccharide export protein [Pseudomonas sp. ok272]SFM90074.1 capsular polysaccharide export protein [Pseudomonas sp. ok602]